jgi:hypothetical protein
MSDSEWYHDVWWDVVYADEIDEVLDAQATARDNWWEDQDHDMQCTCRECLRVLGYGYEYAGEE